MRHSDRLAPGTRVGDYVIEADSGDGYLATHVLLPRRARLDLMHATFVGLRPVVVRMMREACILEALRHPGVPRVFEVGVLAEGRTHRPWVATELIDGVPLSAINQPPPAADVITILRDVADVLAHVHRRGVAHRNLSAATIVLDTEGSRGYPLCVTEWSDARAHGTHDADRAFAADVYSLAMVVRQLLGDRRPSARLAYLLEDMTVANPMSRPIAAEVVARAKLIIENLAREGDDPIVEELVLIDSISAPTERPVLSKPRWTPPLGVASAPEPPRPDGIAIGVLKPRS